MNEYDTHLAQVLNVKGEDLTYKITDVNDLNRLSLDELFNVFSDNIDE